MATRNRRTSGPLIQVALFITTLPVDNDGNSFFYGHALADEINLSFGTVYPLLHRLKEDGVVGLVKPTEQSPIPIKENDRPDRKVYRLGIAGRETLKTMLNSVGINTYIESRLRARATGWSQDAPVRTTRDIAAGNGFTEADLFSARPSVARHHINVMNREISDLEQGI